MARSTLPIALKLMFGHEGGYSNVKTDKGGPTKYGVTHRTLAAHRGVKSVTADQVRGMTITEAEAIYRAGYWTQSGGDLLPVGLDYAAFDFGVNSGPARAVKTLQKVVGVAQDGNAGPQTLAAVRAYSGGVKKLIVDYCEARMTFLRGLTNPKTGFPVNGRGWTIRVTGKDPDGRFKDELGVVGNALKMATAIRLGPSIEDVEEPTGAKFGGDAKAEPEAPNPWKKPEVLAPIGGLLTSLGAVVADNEPLQWAMALGVVGLIGVGVFYAVHRIRSIPA